MRRELKFTEYLLGTVHTRLPLTFSNNLTTVNINYILTHLGSVLRVLYIHLLNFITSLHGRDRSLPYRL